MNPKLQKIQWFFRNSRLLGTIEKLRYLISVVKCFRKNRKFIRANPGFMVPPKSLAYDAYSAPDWNFYKKSGEETALFLAGLARKYLPGVKSPRLFEWGCGPGRVIRHIASAFSVNDNIYGSDYNHATIKWCKENIPHVYFNLNKLQPPLPFDKDFFDFIYSISVITHLSESISHLWIAELFRTTRPGGIIIITTNGDSRKNIMLPDELEAYQRDGFVIRGKIEEGKKMFWACHSPQYLREKLFAAFEVLEYVSVGFPCTGQDCWVLRKPV